MTFLKGNSKTLINILKVSEVLWETWRRSGFFLRLQELTKTSSCFSCDSWKKSCRSQSAHVCFTEPQTSPKRQLVLNWFKPRSETGSEVVQFGFTQWDP